MTTKAGGEAVRRRFRYFISFSDNLKDICANRFKGMMFGDADLPPAIGNLKLQQACTRGLISTSTSSCVGKKLQEEGLDFMVRQWPD